jgi:hypothetical protein
MRKRMCTWDNQDMGPKTAIGGIALMLLGVGIPAFFKVSWGWGGVLCFVGVVLLVVSCSAWVFGRKSPGLQLDVSLYPVPGVPATDKTHGAKGANAATDPIAADQETLRGLQEVFPGSAIAALRVQQFWTTFEWRFDAILLNFYRWGLLPEHRFLHDDMEEIHARLRGLAHKLWDAVHRYSEKLSPTNEEARGFTPLGPITDMAEHEAHRNEVWETATQVCKTYDELVTSARQRFSGIKVTPISQNSDPVVVLGYGPGHEYDRSGFTVTNTSDHEARAVGLEESRLEGWKLDSKPLIDRLPKNSAPVLLPVNLTDRYGVTEHNTIDDVLREVQADCGRVKLALAWKDPSGNSFRCAVSVSTIPLRLGLEPEMSHGPIVKTYAALARGAGISEAIS